MTAGAAEVRRALADRPAPDPDTLESIPAGCLVAEGSPLRITSVSGALAASRKGMDIFGFCVLALMPAVGGGTIRDIIIDRVPVFWVSDNRYIAVAIIAALVVFFAPHRKPGGRRQLLIWADALGLALFAALGTEVCLQHDTGPLVAVMLGVTTAVTGGMIRDVICNEIPLILSREIYATAAFAASLATSDQC